MLAWAILSTHKSKVYVGNITVNIVNEVVYIYFCMAKSDLIRNWCYRAYIVVTVTVLVRRVCVLASSEIDTLYWADGKRERLQPKPLIGFHLTLPIPQTPQKQQSPPLNTLWI